MKKVVSESTVAHLWANQKQDEARVQRGNFYFRGATIYSYGSHFPIATIDGHNCLFTLRTYSVTTSGHLHSARSAASHKEFIYMKEVPTNDYNNKGWKKENKKYSALHERNLNYWKSIISAALSELNNSRIRNINSRLSEINTAIAQVEKYFKYWGLKVTDREYKKLVKEGTDVKWVERQAELDKKALLRTGITEEEREANRIKREAKEQRDFETYFGLWQAYDETGLENLSDSVKKNAGKYIAGDNSYSRRRAGNDSFRWGFTDRDGFTRLRFNREKNRVETSKNVEIPEAIAKIVWQKIKDCTNCKGLKIDVVGYTLTEANDKYILAGCHKIPTKDVQYIAGLLNWN